MLFICVSQGLPGNTGPQGRQGPPGPIVRLFSYYSQHLFVFLIPVMLGSTNLSASSPSPSPSLSLFSYCLSFSQGSPGAPGAPGPGGSAGSQGDRGLPVSENVAFC